MDRFLVGEPYSYMVYCILLLFDYFSCPSACLAQALHFSYRGKHETRVTHEWHTSDWWLNARTNIHREPERRVGRRQSTWVLCKNVADSLGITSNAVKSVIPLLSSSAKSPLCENVVQKNRKPCIVLKTTYILSCYISIALWKKSDKREVSFNW